MSYPAPCAGEREAKKLILQRKIVPIESVHEYSNVCIRQAKTSRVSLRFARPFAEAQRMVLPVLLVVVVVVMICNAKDFLLSIPVLKVIKEKKAPDGPEVEGRS